MACEEITYNDGSGCPPCCLTLDCDDCAVCVPRFLCVTGTIANGPYGGCCSVIGFRADAQQLAGVCVWYGYDGCLTLRITIVKLEGVCYTKVESATFADALLFEGVFPTIDFTEVGVEDGSSYTVHIVREVLSINPLKDLNCSGCADVPCVSPKICVKLKLDAAPVSGFACNFPAKKALFEWDCASQSWIGPSPTFTFASTTYTVTIILLDDAAGSGVNPGTAPDIYGVGCLAKAHLTGPNGVDAIYWFNPLADFYNPEQFRVVTGPNAFPANTLIGHITFTDGTCSCRVFSDDCRWGCPELRFRLTQCDPPFLIAEVVNPGCNSDGLSWHLIESGSGSTEICHTFFNSPNAINANCCAIVFTSLLYYQTDPDCRDHETVDVSKYKLHLIGGGTCKPDGVNPYHFDSILSVDTANSSCDPVILTFAISKTFFDPQESPGHPCCDGNTDPAYIRITL